jgi:hypothetical protein
LILANAKPSLLLLILSKVDQQNMRFVFGLLKLVSFGIFPRHDAGELYHTRQAPLAKNSPPGSHQVSTQEQPRTIRRRGAQNSPKLGIAAMPRSDDEIAETT